ncbi:MAG: hypothetical protein AABW71_05040 [Nanoarchaeota archaeon]
MANNTEYKPDYLKVTPKGKDDRFRALGGVLREHSQIIQRANRSIEPDPRMFGYFNELFRTGNWLVLKFDAYSADLGIEGRETAYSTRAQALNAAIRHLDNEGYEAKPFDLEGMINKV